MPFTNRMLNESADRVSRIFLLAMMTSSLAARAITGECNYDLVRLDAGALYDKYVGESENRLKKALELAQKLAPAVLWIDEIEKAFASAGASDDADAGLSQRLLATLPTWMQDRQSGEFLAATSNNITILPPEMVRKGRGFTRNQYS